MEAEARELESKLSTNQYKVLKVRDHDCRAFTEGLKYYDGALYESAGGDEGTPGIGLSSILRTFLNGRYSTQVKIDKKYFAEGLTILGDKIFQLTYTTEIGFIYNLNDFKQIDQFSYTGPGWGLTDDRRFLIMSDGTHVLRFLDPLDNFKVVGTLNVTERGKPLEALNELEYVNGKVYANVFGEERIVCIDHQSGNVVDSINLKKLCHPFQSAGVLNGIACDEKCDRWFVTGKNWPKLFEIRIKGHPFS